MNVVDYRPWHHDAFEPRDYEQGFRALFGDPRAYADTLGTHGIARTLIERGEPVGCMGVLQLWSGVGEAWVSLSTKFEIGRPTKRWAAAALLFRDELDDVMGSHFHRVQTAIPVGFEPGHRLAMHLGFEAEGLRAKYGPDGADYLGFART